MGHPAVAAHRPPERDPVNASQRWLERACLAFAGLGLLLPFAYHTPLFAAYRDAVARHVGDPYLATGGATIGLLLGITGGSIAGKWLAHYAVARFALRRGLRWAWQASAAGLLTWFVIDSVASCMAGAWMNILLVNLTPMVVVGPLLLRLRVRCNATGQAAVATLQGPARLVAAGCVVGVGSGLAIAFAGNSPLFAPWFDGLARAQFAGMSLPPAARALTAWFFGPIGGTVAAQFVLLACIAVCAIAAAESWASKWSLASILAWFAIDSGYGIVHQGWFNIAMVNIPTVLLIVPPLLWAARRTALAGDRTI